MTFLLSCFRKDMNRWRQDLTAVLLWLGIPFMIGGLITLMVDSDGGMQPQGGLLIVDHDETLVSGLVATAFGQGGLGDLISVETVELDEGMMRIDAGEASGLLIIPEGFSAALIESTPVTLTLRTNPSQTILPGIITDVTEILLDAGFYLHQVFGDEISQIAGSQDDGEEVPGSEFVAAVAVSIQQKIETVAPQLFPPAIELTMVEPPEEQPGVPVALLFLPGIILMSVLLASNSLASDFWLEREQGTLRRLVHAPSRLLGFIAGKALAATAVITLVAGIALTVGFAYHELPWSRFPSAITWLALSSAAMFSWFAVLQTAFPNQQAASIFSLVLLFPLMMAGGSFFPLAVLPGWIASIGRLSPNGFMTDRLTTELTAASSWAIDGQSWAIIIAVVIGGLGICFWRVRSGFAEAPS
jgi:ABC-2 type transport system permease protein